MDRVSMVVTTLGLLVLLVVSPPHLLQGTATGGATPPAPSQTACPRPGFGAADTDAVLLCLAAQHQTP